MSGGAERVATALTATDDVLDGLGAGLTATPAAFLAGIFAGIFAGAGFLAATIFAGLFGGILGGLFRVACLATFALVYIQRVAKTGPRGPRIISLSAARADCQSLLVKAHL